MFVLEDTVLLCEQYLADGRKITRDLMNEVRSALFSSNPDLDAIKGFGEKVWKEIARIPAALVEEAKGAAKNGDILAAAEMACARKHDEFLDVYALSKGQDFGECGSMVFCHLGKA